MTTDAKHLTPTQALIEATGLDLLADCEEDLDNARKAKRLRKMARDIRSKHGLGPAVVVEGQVTK